VRRWHSAVLIGLLVVAVASLSVATPAAATHEAPTNETGASIQSVYPNPLTPGDEGEFLVLEIPTQRRLHDYTIGDDHRRVSLPNVTADGQVVLTDNRSALTTLVDGPFFEVSAWPRLANGGDSLELRHENRTVDTISYDRAPEGELATAAGASLSWRPLGGTEMDVVRGNTTTVQAFTLPDAPGVPLDVLRKARDRINLAAYTLESRRVVDALLGASESGVEVTVLVESGPVGGITNRSANLLDELDANGVTVTVARRPYRFHHAKYALVDDRAIVSTENWKPAGTGGRSSRGWGVLTSDAAVVSGLGSTFRADTRDRNTVQWSEYRDGRTFSEAEAANGTYPERFEPARLRAERIELLVAPDNAATRLESLIEDADRSVRVIQVGIGSRENRLLSAAIDILLSSAWYVSEDNRALVSNLTALANREGLPLSVRLADPNGRFEKIHAKGLIVDGEHVAVGSLNWNRNAFQNNREVVVLLTGEEVADYYGQVFEADWKGGVRLLPAGVIAAVFLIWIGVLLRGWRVSFEETNRDDISTLEFKY